MKLWTVFVVCLFFGVLILEVPQGLSFEQISPELFRVEGSSSCGQRGPDEFGSGRDFAEALRQIGKEYVIKSITPIDYYCGQGYGNGPHRAGSYTKEILVVVEPRKATAKK